MFEATYPVSRWLLRVKTTNPGVSLHLAGVLSCCDSAGKYTNHTGCFCSTVHTHLEALFDGAVPPREDRVREAIKTR